MTLRSIPSARCAPRWSFLSLPSPAKTKRTSGKRVDDSRKALEEFQMPLARLEDGEHQHHGGPWFVGREPEQIAPVFGLAPQRENETVRSPTDHMVPLRCTDACPDAQIAHAGTDVDEGVRHPLDRPLRRQVHERLESADVDEGHDVHAV